MEVCKYFDNHLETIKEYIRCLYEIKGCMAAGLLHALIDEDNYDNATITCCLQQCLLHPERKEAALGKLICEEYLKLSMPQRRLLTAHHFENQFCDRNGKCHNCFIEKGENLNGQS